jgi:hypothetical protein
MATKKEAPVNIPTAAVADPFAGLVEESTSSMTVWSQVLQSALDKETAVRFADGKRAVALETVYKFLQQQELNPIVRYVAVMGLKTLNRKVGK